MRSLMFLSGASVLLTACATTAAPIDDALSDAPAAVRAVIMAERPDFVVKEAERKPRENGVYWDVEGEVDDGSELEFDVLLTDDGAEIVEIQRDLEWSDVPDEVREVALEASGGVEPVRTIESVQTDGSVIYELFADGAPSDPAYEVRVWAGEVELLAERWVH